MTVTQNTKMFNFSLLQHFLIPPQVIYMYIVPLLTGLSAVRVESWSSGNWKHFLSGSMEFVSTDSLTRGITLKATST